MDRFTHESYMLRLALTKYVDAIFYQYHNMRNIKHSDFSIMGGFARRIYMLENNIPMTDVDKKGLIYSDVDLFFNNTNHTDFHKIVDRHNEEMKKEDRFSYIPAFADLFKEFSDLKIKFNSGEKFKNPIIDNMLPYLIFLFNDGENEKNTNERTREQKEGNICSNKSFFLDLTRGKFVLPLSDTFQIISSPAPNIDIIENFDMENSKFKLDYPYHENKAEKIGNVDDDSIYTVKDISIPCESPVLKQFLRLKKYSEYGFVFEDIVKEKLLDAARKSTNVINNLPYSGSDEVYV